MKITKKIMALGLAGLVTILSACNGKRIEGAKITGNEYKEEAVINIYKKGAPMLQEGIAIRIFDLDGQKDSNGQESADEVFIYPGDPSISNYFWDLDSRDVSEWKHYVSSGVNKPLVSNNITPMTPEQRKLYSKILNLYYEAQKK